MPNLINPIWITIKPLDRSAMVFDDEVRAPIASGRSTQVVSIKAQYQEAESQVIDQQTGELEPTKGYIVVRKLDLRQAGIVLKRGDQIIRKGRGPNADEANVFLTIKQDAAIYGDAGGTTLQVWYFSDRKPVRQVGDL